MRSCTLILCLLLAVALSACDGTVLPIDEPQPCVCGDDGSGCGDDWCSYSLLLLPNCLGKVTHAEVMIDGHLETELLGFGPDESGEIVPQYMYPCTQTAPGAQTRIDVFGGKWQWSSVGNSCEDAHESNVVPLEFNCTAE